MTEQNHAIDNAMGWLETVREYVAGYQGLLSGDVSSVEIEGQAYESASDVVEAIYQAPLSVLVRDDWRSVTQNELVASPTEFEVLLTTGGPALRIYGELDEHSQPETAFLEWQDWGTPWTRLQLESADLAIVKEFASHFYYGEG